jgi:hypothetical protein
MGTGCGILRPSMGSETAIDTAFPVSLPLSVTASNQNFEPKLRKNFDFRSELFTSRFKDEESPHQCR